MVHRQPAKRLRGPWLLGCLVLATMAQVQAQLPDTLVTCRDAAAAGLKPSARAALARIEGDDRRLLALRGYLRAGDTDPRWSWSEAQIKAYDGSPEQQQAHAEVARVQARFAADNPGYALHVNLQVRSLDEQLRKWNGNASVGAAAQALQRAAAGACTPATASSFAGWLRAWRPPAPVNLAVPGLSPHGQGRAYDFQVMQGDTLVAGTDSSRRQSDWVEGGWAERLAAAVQASGARFEGPLRSPDEPWHYAYVPEPRLP